MKQLAALVTALLIAFAASACGSGGDGESSAVSGPAVTASSLSSEEFQQQATQICHRERRDILTEFSDYLQKHQGSFASSGEEFAAATRAVLLPTIESELAKIQALGAPEGDEEQVSAFLAAEHEAVDEVAKQKSLRSVTAIEAYFDAAAELAGEYGIPDCGNSSRVTN